MNVLVTGGAGFIGSHLVDALIKEGHSVRVYDSLCPPTHKERKLPSFFNIKAEFIQGDIRSKKNFQRAIDGSEVVFHLAAEISMGQSMYQIKKYSDVNIGGIANLLEILTTTRQRVKKIIFSSSATAYGEGAYNCLGSCGIVYPEIRSEEQIKKGMWEYLCPTCGEKLIPIPTKETKPLASQFHYAITKEAGEKMLLSVGKAYNIPCTVLRFFNVYGPRQSLTNPHSAVFAVFLARIKEGKPPIVIEDGQETRDFIFVDDVVRACLAAMKRKESNFEIINIGTGKPVTIEKVARELIKLSGKKLKPEINFLFRKGDVRHCFASISKARKLLGWEPKVSFEEGVEKMYKWAKDQYAEDSSEKAFAVLLKKGLASKGKGKK